MSDGGPATRRQEIQRMLEDAEYGFEELREVMRVPLEVLEDDLRHLDKSLRAGNRRLRVEPARCGACGFLLRVRPGRYATPARCPRCRAGQIMPARLAVR